MAHGLVQELRDQGRGMLGALVFGTPFLFTMETWWLAGRLATTQILAYAVAGVVLVVVLVNVVGFRREEEDRRPSLPRLAANVAEVIMQSFVVAIAVLFVFGVLEVGDPAELVVRMGFMHLIPLALGAALANRALARVEEDDEVAEAPFPKDVALFALGALFFVFPIAPTEEMELMAAHAGPSRIALALVASLVVTYLALYEVAFRGQRGRLAGLSGAERVGETFLVYAVAWAVAFLMLGAFGHFEGRSVLVWVQLATVLAFPATLGGSAARVVL